MTAERATPRTAALALALVALLTVFAVRLADSAARQSLTYDEPHYVGTGMVLWSTGDYHFARALRFHPPLAYHIASLPFLAIDHPPLEPYDTFSRRLRAGPDPSPATVRWLSRLPFALLACWGALLLFCWAREIAGPWAGLLAVALYTWSPTILANASLAHSDITVTVFYLQTLYALWRWREHPTSSRLVVCGLSLGLALASKLSALLLLPAVALLSVEAPLAGLELPASAGARLRRLMVWLGTCTATMTVLASAAVCVLWLSYGGSFAISKGIGGPYEHVELPGYLHSLLFDVRANELGRRTFFLGDYSDQGWWYFFPTVFAVKTPIGMLVLIALAALRRRPDRRTATRFLLVPIAVYLAVACLWLHVPLGLRYILPVIPLIHLLVAVRLVPLAVPWQRAIAGAALAWLAVAGAVIHPHYIAYFNEFLGGPPSAYRYFVESNLDWGQDLPALAEYLHAKGDPDVKLAYFGAEDPADYGIRYERLTGCEPTSGLIAISANVLQGLYSTENPFKQPPPGCYDWLLAREPVAQPGYSILVYEVPPDR